MSENLRKIFADICRGYSKVRFDNNSDNDSSNSDNSSNNNYIYIKHLSHFDQIDIEGQNALYYDEAKSRGLFTLKEKLDYLEKEGLWTPKDQNSLDENKLYLDNLIKTRDNLAFKSQIDSINKQINEAVIKYNELFIKKSNLVGLVCENQVEKRMENFYIQLLFYKDEKLLNKMFNNNDDFDKLDDYQIENLIDIYVKFIKDLSIDNIRKISVMQFFISLLYLSDNINTFFNCPLCSLTYNQVNLLSYGLYYKNIFQHNDIPKDINENPDRIEEFVKKSNNIKQMIERGNSNNNQRIGVVGASREELKAMGGGETPEILKYANQKGGIDSIFMDKNMERFR